MKKWNAPEMVELAIENTANRCNGETPTTGATHKYKTKTNQCECGHNTNFAFDVACDCGGNSEITGDDTVVTDRLSA